MEEQNAEEVGFLESSAGRKSNSRLTVIICACICVFAALIEGCGKIVSILKGDCTATADWESIAFLTAVILLGNAAVKAAQRLNINPTNPTN